MKDEGYDLQMKRKVLAFIVTAKDLPMLHPCFYVGWYSLSEAARAATPSRLTAHEEHLP